MRSSTRSVLLLASLTFVAAACSRSSDKDAPANAPAVAPVPAMDATPPADANEPAPDAPAAHDPATAPAPADAKAEGIPPAGGAPAGDVVERKDPVGTAMAPRPEDQAPPLAHPGHPCDVQTFCGEGYGCSGLFRTASGVCIPEAEAKAACKDKHGEWGAWSMLQRRYCMPVFADAGKSCRDDSECKGDCILMDKDKDNASAAKCQKHEMQFGCFSRMSNGKPTPMLCVD